MRTVIHRRLSVAVMIVIMSLLVTGVVHEINAQETASVRIAAGDTLEIGTDANPGSEFSWVLTKDRKFQNAQRTAFFQTRIAEPGTYLLDVNIRHATLNENALYSFSIIVTDPTGVVPVPPDKTQPLFAVLRTDPPMVGGLLYVPPAGGIVKIDPSGSQGDINSYALDLDTGVDSNGDGNATNDVDNRETFSEKTGTPVYQFFLPKTTPRSVRLTVTSLANATPSSTEAPVVFGQAPFVPSSASSSSLAPDPNSPVQMDIQGFEVRFRAPLGPEHAGKQLLYEWDFGDGDRSLLTAPVHTYGRSGVFTIGLLVRDITNGNEVYAGTDTLVIDQGVVPSSSVSSSVTSSSSSSAPAQGGSGVSFMGIFQVMIIIVLLLALAIGLYFLLVWLKKKTASGLQQTLEKMEGTIVQKDAKPGIVAKAEPMKLKKEVPKDMTPGKQDVLEREKSKPEFKTQSRPPETPSTTTGPVPSWLAKAGTKPSFSATPASSAPSPKPAPAPEPKPQAQTPPAPSSGPVPSWLKPATPQASAPAPQSPKPAPAPAPAPKPEPKPQPPVATPPKPVPAPKPAEPQPKPQPPAPPPKPEQQPSPAAVPKKPDDGEPPIAIIKADSLTK